MVSNAYLESEKKYIWIPSCSIIDGLQDSRKMASCVQFSYQELCTYLMLTGEIDFFLTLGHVVPKEICCLQQKREGFKEKYFLNYHALMD